MSHIVSRASVPLFGVNGIKPCSLLVLWQLTLSSCLAANGRPQVHLSQRTEVCNDKRQWSLQPMGATRMHHAPCSLTNSWRHSCSPCARHRCTGSHHSYFRTVGVNPGELSHIRRQLFVWPQPRGVIHGCPPRRGWQYKHACAWGKRPAGRSQLLRLKAEVAHTATTTTTTAENKSEGGKGRSEA